jgi:undecaprenyl phosphate N,N'-diacetylbacillosamine 1-phosphate transferase
MTDARDKNGNLLSDEERLTDFGKKLRSTSLDELPELINIIKGDMSFVGPRPLLVSYLPYYNERERKRHSVRPGLTGLAQVSGRNNLKWNERFELDVKYAESISFIGDIKIILLTIQRVIMRTDVSVDSSEAEGNFAELRKLEQV